MKASSFGMLNKLCGAMSQCMNAQMHTRADVNLQLHSLRESGRLVMAIRSRSDTLNNSDPQRQSWAGLLGQNLHFASIAINAEPLACLETLTSLSNADYGR